LRHKHICNCITQSQASRRWHRWLLCLFTHSVQIKDNMHCMAPQQLCIYTLFRWWLLVW